MTMKQITIATYNIRHGHDVGCDWSRIAAIVASVHADIVGFQEIDMHTDRIGGRDTVSGLAEATGMSHTLFVPAMNFNGGQYGTAILSRFPLTTCECHPLESGTYEPRAFGAVTVALDDGTPLHFLNTHLSYESHEQQDVQLAQIARFMDKYIPRNAPAILTGDFNTENFSAFDPLRSIGYALINNDTHTYKTFRTSPVAIDNIVYRHSILTPVEHGMIDSNCSDHNLLWCRFSITCES